MRGRGLGGEDTCPGSFNKSLAEPGFQPRSCLSPDAILSLCPRWESENLRKVFGEGGAGHGENEPLALHYIRVRSAANTPPPHLSPAAPRELQFSKRTWLVGRLPAGTLLTAGRHLRAQEPHRRRRRLLCTPRRRDGVGAAGREYLQEEARGGQPRRLAQHLLAAHSPARGCHQETPPPPAASSREDHVTEQLTR